MRIKLPPPGDGHEYGRAGAGGSVVSDGAGSDAAPRIRDSLVPGGRLIVDVPVPQAATEHEPMRYWRHGCHLWTLQTMHIEYDPAANQMTRLLRYDKWQDGTLRMTELQMFRLQYWSMHEFEDLLAEAGFTGVLVTAGYRNACIPRPGDGIWTFHATAPQAR
jgi:hypothetical protein